ncbi:MAG TPA: TfoX/Sxy family protein [Solirubrobacteraceae bacterium]|nr:TfoX/Sxy family protein [Solirubrobacteraceae bacterium]
MAYDEELAQRIRELLVDHPGVVEKRMFGGLAFLIGGNMSVAASGQGGLLVRCDPEESEAWLAEPHASSMVMRGRPMSGWLTVSSQGVASEADLERWVRRGVTYAASLPSK